MCIRTLKLIKREEEKIKDLLKQRGYEDKERPTPHRCRLWLFEARKVPKYVPFTEEVLRLLEDIEPPEQS